MIALSVDPLEKAREMAERTAAAFPIGYGLKVPEDADKVGAYWEERRGIIHATNFTIDSDGKVLQACFATGPHRTHYRSRRFELASRRKKEKGPRRLVSTRLVSF